MTGAQSRASMLREAENPQNQGGCAMNIRHCGIQSNYTRLLVIYFQHFSSTSLLIPFTKDLFQLLLKCGFPYSKFESWRQCQCVPQIASSTAKQSISRRGSIFDGIATKQPARERLSVCLIGLRGYPSQRAYKTWY